MFGAVSSAVFWLLLFINLTWPSVCFIKLLLLHFIKAISHEWLHFAEILPWFSKSFSFCNGLNCAKFTVSLSLIAFIKPIAWLLWFLLFNHSIVWSNLLYNDNFTWYLNLATVFYIAMRVSCLRYYSAVSFFHLIKFRINLLAPRDPFLVYFAKWLADCTYSFI